MQVNRSEEKNEIIKNTYGRKWIGFEEVERAIEENRILNIIENKNQKKYPWQMILIVEIKNYAWEVPMIESEKWRFLKTMFPSRKATKIYLSK